jgi:hypothetical protein
VVKNSLPCFGERSNSRLPIKLAKTYPQLIPHFSYKHVTPSGFFNLTSRQQLHLSAVAEPLEPLQPLNLSQPDNPITRSRQPDNAQLTTITPVRRGGTTKTTTTITTNLNNLPPLCFLYFYMVKNLWKSFKSVVKISIPVLAKGPIPDYPSN